MPVQILDGPRLTLHLPDIARGRNVEVVRSLTTLPRDLNGLALSHKGGRVHLKHVALGSDSSGRDNCNSGKSLSVHCVEGKGKEPKSGPSSI